MNFPGVNISDTKVHDGFLKFVSSIKNQTKKLAFIFLHQNADVEVETVLNEISGASIQLLDTMSNIYSLQLAGVEKEEFNITEKQWRKLSKDLKNFRTDMDIGHGYTNKIQ